MNNLEFREIKDNKEWDQIVQSLPVYSFLNSSARYDYNNAVYPNSEKVAVFQGGQTIGIAPSYVVNGRLKYLYTQHAPLLKTTADFEKCLPEIINYYKDKARRNKCEYVEISPLVIETPEIKKTLAKTHAINAPIRNIDALITLHIDLTQTIDQLRTNLRDSTRYNINKITKDQDYQVKIFKDSNQMDLFFKFFADTMKVKGYKDKPRELFEREFNEYLKNDMLYWVVGYFKGQPIGIWQNVKYGKYFANYQAALDATFRKENMRIAYLLFYETLKLGKELGCEVLDMFGGMAPDNCKKHPWLGVQSFKLGLGGKKITYAHVRDYPVTKGFIPSYALRYLATVRKGYTVKW